MEKQRVVRIGTGEAQEAYLFPASYGWTRVWFRVNKNGSEPGNRYSDGDIERPGKLPGPSHFALYDAAREESANPIRAEIRRHQQAARDAEARLCAWYREEAKP